MNIIFLVVILIVITIIYINSETYVVDVMNFNKKCTCKDVSCRFYQNYTDINKSNKSKLFIHLSQERNERNWLNFGSRSSEELNMDICLLCIESIITFCDDLYQVIIYTNDDISKMIPDDELCSIENPNLLSGVDLKQWESYCKFKLLDVYGGVVMEPHFLFIASPPEIFYKPKALTVCEMNNEGMNLTNLNIIPSFGSLMVSPKGDETVKFYLDYFKNLCHNDYSVSTQHFDRASGKIDCILKFPSEQIGTTDAKGNPLYLENLFSNENFSLSSNNFCLFINMELLKRNRKYGWILKMSKSDIETSNMFFSNVSRME